MLWITGGSATLQVVQDGAAWLGLQMVAAIERDLIRAEEPVTRRLEELVKEGHLPRLTAGEE